MKKLLLSLTMAGILAGCTTQLDEIQETTSTNVNIDNFKTICIFDYTPNIEYKSLKYYKSGRNLIGPVSSVMPKFLNYADRLDGNTIINFEGKQRFGFWPWRIVRPIAYGTAVDWVAKNNDSCKSLGGRVYAIKSNKKVIDITDQI